MVGVVVMKCPKCGDEMESGQFTLPNKVIWYSGDRRRFLMPEDQIWLAGRWNLIGTQAEGYICRKCKWACFEYPGG